ncbi:MAG: group I intron-associated PD-(D/E)XK endonuclease [Bacteroidia bacterium]|nr:group I intron-associated PD-(D/E)XK endonuclease [Bacteroidia bacterium]
MKNTKLKGDIAEQRLILEALKRGWGVSIPLGDRLPYDLILDINSTLLKIQIKSAWFDQVKGNYVIDVRRSLTNQRTIIHRPYSLQDFDFAIIYLDEIDIFYILPTKAFLSYKSEIHFVEAEKRQRKPQSAKYREAWHLLM